DGDGIDDIGLFQPESETNRILIMRDPTGQKEIFGPFVFGKRGDIPITGDWDGDGDDNIGVYRPSTKQFFFDSNVPNIPRVLTLNISANNGCPKSTSCSGLQGTTFSFEGNGYTPGAIVKRYSSFQGNQTVLPPPEFKATFKSYTSRRST